jgi:hypothetical protein
MSTAVAMASTIILSVVLWVLYYMIFGDQPENNISVVIVGIAAICVFITRSIVARFHK